VQSESSSVKGGHSVSTAMPWSDRLYEELMDGETTVYICAKRYARSIYCGETVRVN